MEHVNHMAWNRSSVLTIKSVVKSKQISSNKLITTNILAQTMNKLVSKIEMTTIRRRVFICNKSAKSSDVKIEDATTAVINPFITERHGRM